MSSIHKVAIFGAAGNFGTPITSSLLAAGFEVTAISRLESSATFPPGVTVVRTEYTTEHLRTALAGQDAAVCVAGPAAVVHHVAMIDAAHTAGVKRFIINDFGWGPGFRSEPEFGAIGARRSVAWDHANELAAKNSSFTWTGITIGNPIDWALQRFPLMGFDIKQRSAIIYDNGTEEFTGTTLEGIGQAVVGVFTDPISTANRFVKVRSIQTCQNQLLEAFRSATGDDWVVSHGTAKELQDLGRRMHKAGEGSWVLNLVVFQMFEPGKGRCIVTSRSDSDAKLLGVREESAAEVVVKAMK